MRWYNEPPQWAHEGDTITITGGARTDFWRKTHDGGVRDNGHFYYQEVTGDFVAEVKVAGRYADLYDQAGLMVRLDEATWLKCGIEYMDGVQHASAVVTRDYSDWSIVPLANPPAIRLRVRREGGTLAVSYSTAMAGEVFQMIRQAYLSDAPTLQAGVLVAAPMGAGFEAVFENFAIRQA